MSETVIARLRPSIARRILAAGSPGGLGVVILLLAVSYPAQSLGLLAGLVVLAFACLIFALWVWQVTERELVLTTEALREVDGRTLFHVADVARIERGLMAWKPAGGFAVVLSQPMPRVWAPGLWWRSGRRVMVGGATNGGEAKAMADLMQAEIARRG